MSKISLSYNQYLDWYHDIDEQSTARQSLAEEEYYKFLDDESITKIILMDDDVCVGLIITARDPSKTQFYNPEYFNDIEYKNTLYIPRGGMSVNPLVPEEDYTKVVCDLVRICNCNKFVIDITGDGPIGPYAMFTNSVILDQMIGVAWQKDKCITEYKLPEKMDIVTIYDGSKKPELLEKTWKVFQDGFDNSGQSACPPVFCFDEYSEMFSDHQIGKIFLSNDNEIIGAVVVMPLDFIPFINKTVLSKVFVADQYFFVLEMTILKMYRGLENLKNLGRAFVSLLPDKTGIVMDHSHNLNPGFNAAIRRTYKLDKSDVLEIGRQKYELCFVV